METGVAPVSGFLDDLTHSQGRRHLAAASTSRHARRV